ncbi:MAG: hypothetical protein JSR46_05965, partial [Verrucomicrobia bacterium]|nr:hypothetical protein [Verrucomicrobiota bacterium]
DFLQSPDPDDPDKLVKDNYIICVDPSLLGKLQTRASLANIFKLSNDLFNFKGPPRVFDEGSLTEAFLTRTEYPKNVGLFIMRKSLVEGSRELIFDKMEKIVIEKGLGLKPAPLRERAFVDSISILRSGTCFDDRGKETWSYTVTPDTITFSGQTCHLYIGGYSPKAGVYVHTSNYPQKCLGIVPYASVADEVDDLSMRFENMTI